VADDRAVKIVARPPAGDLRDADELLAVVEAAVGGLIQATHSNIHDVLIEFSAAGVTKGSTLALLATELGYSPHEVAAVGDMPNDASMLAWAGEPYVVANAHASLLAQFARVLPRNDEDAVGQLLIELSGAL
jgi:hydroxymethylpyrimidine pyrophosphatase-like HAD family hydrolase